MTFENFKADMWDKYDDSLSIERLNNNGNYEPSNCTWATRVQQANNRRTSKIIELNGVRKTLEQWIREIGIKSSTARQRFYVYKWPIGQALGLEDR